MIPLDHWLLEYIGSAAGIAGSIILAYWPRHSLTAYWIWQVSNLCLIAYAGAIGAFGMAAMNLTYLAINFVGIKRRLNPKPS